MARSILWSAAALVVVYVLLVTAAWLFQRKLIYFPDSSAPPPAHEVIAGARDVTLHTSDGLELGAWLIPPTDDSDERITVLVANGNAGTRADRSDLGVALAAEGFQVLLFDYRGYAGNPGSPTEDGLALDVRAAYDFLVQDAGVAPTRLILFGESLGSAVVAGLAVRVPVAGVVLRSPFSSLAAVGQDHYPFLPVGPLLKDDFAVERAVRSIVAPVTVVYGGGDSTIDPDQSRAVAAAAPHLLDLVEVAGADHNDESLAYGQVPVRAVVQLAGYVQR